MLQLLLTSVSLWRHNLKVFDNKRGAAIGCPFSLLGGQKAISLQPNKYIII